MFVGLIKNLEIAFPLKTLAKKLILLLKILIFVGCFVENSHFFHRSLEKSDIIFEISYPARKTHNKKSSWWILWWQFLLSNDFSVFSLKMRHNFIQAIFICINKIITSIHSNEYLIIQILKPTNNNTDQKNFLITNKHSLIWGSKQNTDQWPIWQAKQKPPKTESPFHAKIWVTQSNSYAKQHHACLYRSISFVFFALTTLYMRLNHSANNIVFLLHMSTIFNVIGKNIYLVHAWHMFHTVS